MKLYFWDLSQNYNEISIFPHLRLEFIIVMNENWLFYLATLLNIVSQKIKNKNQLYRNYLNVTKLKFGRLKKWIKWNLAEYKFVFLKT